MNSLSLFLFSLLPGVEPRYGYIAALVSGATPTSALLLSFIATVCLGVILVSAMRIVDILISRVSPLRRLWTKYVKKAQARVRAYVDKYGWFGLVLFVAIPLPLTGMWTGAVAAYFMGMRRDITLICLVAGGTLALIIVSLLLAAGIVLHHPPPG